MCISRNIFQKGKEKKTKPRKGQSSPPGPKAGLWEPPAAGSVAGLALRPRGFPSAKRYIALRAEANAREGGGPVRGGRSRGSLPWVLSAISYPAGRARPRLPAQPSQSLASVSAGPDSLCPTESGEREGLRESGAEGGRAGARHPQGHSARPCQRRVWVPARGPHSSRPCSRRHCSPPARAPEGKPRAPSEGRTAALGSHLPVPQFTLPSLTST